MLVKCGNFYLYSSQLSSFNFLWVLYFMNCNLILPVFFLISFNFKLSFISFQCLQVLLLEFILYTLFVTYSILSLFYFGHFSLLFFFCHYLLTLQVSLYCFILNSLTFSTKLFASFLKVMSQNYFYRN